MSHVEFQNDHVALSNLRVKGHILMFPACSLTCSIYSETWASPACRWEGLKYRPESCHCALRAKAPVDRGDRTSLKGSVLLWGENRSLFLWGPLMGDPQCRMSILRNGNVACLCPLFSPMSHVKFKKRLCHMSL